MSPPAPYYGGAALEGWKRIGRRPDASDLAWAETSGKARVRCGDPTADKSRRPWTKERRTCRSNPDAGSTGRAFRQGARDPRGRRRAPIKNKSSSSASHAPRFGDRQQTRRPNQPRGGAAVRRTEVGMILTARHLLPRPAQQLACDVPEPRRLLAQERQRAADGDRRKAEA